MSDHDIKVVIITTFPNSFVKKRIGNEAFDARCQASYTAAKSDVEAGYEVIALCDPALQKDFKGTGARLEDDVYENMGEGRAKLFQLAEQVIRRDKMLAQLTAHSVLGIVGWREEKLITPFIPQLIQPIVDEVADITILNRKSFETYPVFSQTWEAHGSNFCNLILGTEGIDYFSGPRFVVYRYVSCFSEHQGKAAGLPGHYDSIFCPLQTAAHLGARIVGIEADFRYDEGQREAEEADWKTHLKRQKDATLLLESMIRWKAHLEAQ